MSPLTLLVLARLLAGSDIGDIGDIGDSDDAHVNIVAFDDAGVAAGVDVVVGDRAVSTPATLVLPAGTWPLRVHGVSVGAVSVAAGAVVDVVLTVQGGEVTIDEAPGVNAGAPPRLLAPTTTAPTTTTPTTKQETRPLRVQVRSLQDGTPVVAARVYLRGGGELGAVDDEGNLDTVIGEAATAISVVAAGFAPAVVVVDAAADAAVVVDVVLLPIAAELDELTVRAPHIGGGVASAVSEERAAKAVVEVIGREQMQRGGDGDAAAALRRVTGLTVVGGRYVYVRGLGDRYSSTLVNGAPLPSPEPEKRVVPLDLFPSTLLESLAVQKTWTPDLPGEFGGGSVQLRTRAAPDQAFASVGVSTTMQLGTTFTNQLLSAGGALDVLAFDDGSRALPDSVKNSEGPLAEGNALTGGGFTKKELEAIGEDLAVRPWSPVRRFVLPGLSLQASAGDTFDTAVGDIGVVGSFTWAQDVQRTDAHRSLTAGNGDAVVVTDELEVATNEATTNWGAVLGLAWQPAEGQRLRALTLANRDAADEARVASGRSAELDGDVRATRLRYLTRQLVVQQLGGEHVLPWAPFSAPLSLTWRAGYALALRDEPGLRSSRYDAVGDRFVLSDRSEGNQMLDSRLVDHGVDSQVELQLPFRQWGDLDAVASAGVAFSGKVREVDTRRFRFLAAGPRAGSLDLRLQSPERIFSDTNIGSDAFMIAEATRPTDNHNGSAAIAATFAKVELPVSGDVVVTAGARLEWSSLSVTTFELYKTTAPPVVAALNNLDALPMLAVAWTLSDDFVLKAATARTVVRPELRELSPALYSDVAGARARFGNPALQETGIVHGDVRGEWALSPKDGLSLALFGKYFDKPIESVVTAGADQAVTANNVDGAWNLGAEVEGRVSLATLGLAPGIAGLDGLFIGGNGALIASQVVIGVEQQGTLTSKERALEGQSPWVLNLQLGTDDDERGFSVVALYNVFGPRIVEVGALGLPDTTEQPFHQLDLVVRQRLPLGLLLSAKAQNLIDLPAERR